MAATYTLRVVTEFAAAHTLRGYPGSCNRLHGHNWKVEVEVCSQVLDEVGMAVDFREIKRITREVTDEMDHRYLNELAAFAEVNPTAENIAAHCFREIGARLDRSAAQVSAVTVWENDRSCARFAEKEA